MAYIFKNIVGMTQIAHIILIMMIAFLLPKLIKNPPNSEPRQEPKIGEELIKELYKFFET